MKRIIAAAGALLLTGGLAGGIATQAQAHERPTLEGSATVRVAGPVQGGGGVWAGARYLQRESLYLDDTNIVTAGVASDDPTKVVIGETIFTYSLRVHDDGVFRAIPWSLTPNQSGWNDGRVIRGSASGELNGFAVYRLVMDLKGDIKAPIVTDPAAVTPQKIIDASLATTPLAYSTTYSASGVRWTFAPGFWRVTVPGHWVWVKATHKRHGHHVWIPTKRVFVPGVWTMHQVSQQWTSASWNDDGQSRSAGNITGFFAMHRR